MHDEFLTALRETPNDDVTRLVYADWLQERDDPLAEFLRLEVRLATGENDPTLRDRLAELGRRADPGWLLAVNRVPFVRLAAWQARGRAPIHGRLELANFSTRALLIAYNCNLLEHLRLAITDPLGAAAECPYDAPTLHSPRQLRLSPGERKTDAVNLLNTIDVAQIMVGAYAVEAIYNYDGVVSRADSVRVEITDDDRRRWKLGRFARG